MDDSALMAIWTKVVDDSEPSAPANAEQHVAGDRDKPVTTEVCVQLRPPVSRQEFIFSRAQPQRLGYESAGSVRAFVAMVRDVAIQTMIQKALRRLTRGSTTRLIATVVNKKSASTAVSPRATSPPSS